MVIRWSVPAMLTRSGAAAGESAGWAASDVVKGVIGVLDAAAPLAEFCPGLIGIVCLRRGQFGCYLHPDGRAYPSAAHQGETLAISLFTIDLDNAAPPFNALSYTWGDPRCPYLDDGPADAGTPKSSYLAAAHVILCDKRRFMARLNLIDALRRLVAAGAGKPEDALNMATPRFVSINAICIDKSNVRERTEQVRMMTRIFASAECILGWLGPAGSTTAAAISVVGRLAATVAAPGSGHQVPRSADDLRAMQRRFAHVVEADFFEAQSFEAKLGVRYITGPEWLVVQEVAVARRIVFVCGHMTLPWSDLAASVSLFRRLAEWHGVDSFPTGPVALVKLRSYSRSDRLDEARTPAFFALRALLVDHRGAQATDPRDKLFAPLGLANRTKPPFLEPVVAAGALAPNYQFTVEAVYIRLARCMIRSYGDLRLLQQRELGGLRKLSSLPSWVPDFSVCQFPTPLGGSAGHDWKAGGDERWNPDGRGLEDPLLTVRWRCIGRVEVALSLLESREATGTGRAWGSMFDLVSRLCHGARLQGRTPLEVLARTVTCDRLQMRSPAPSEALRDQLLAFAAERCAIALKSHGKYSETSDRSLRDQLVGRFHHFNIVHFGHSPGEYRCTPVISAFYAEPAGSPYGAPFLIEKMREYSDLMVEKAVAGDTARQKTVFRTEGDLLLSLSPADMHTGDEVWVLSGSDTPVVLRLSSPPIHHTWRQQQRQRHRLVVQAFVYGMVHGESRIHFPDVQDVIWE
ncbi:heterokaryon incompatibility protein-domain-containing protein [Podospora didyma]|uniref:Heterokaryon incompatibility protein-domain-containing protein n=1 Tax=Podospora didyma TaxID=330526 RepID=A0AAE0U0E3_9PEZI|nr:heterokaryon incompatibility protein-domain-containing protein [Podospora didyma]